MPWEVRFSNSRQLPYFYNSDTSESRWEEPEGLSPEKIYALPGASQHLPPPPPHLVGFGQSPPAAPGHVRASHILAKHAGSRRPASWKSPDRITRSLADAQKIIQGHIDHLKQLSGEEQAREFARIAQTESDCSSAKKGGDLGVFGKGMMQAAFEHAAFGLKPGQLSGIVETDSGVHVILRTA